MATVYLAHDVRHDRKVALKVLRPELSAILGAERFLQEIKTTANLQHPHILGLFDSGEAHGLVFYVMPFVEGESLRDRLNREHQLPVEDAVRITREVADALDYAHRHHVIHRDIKPENILLHDGRAQVADFGIALAVSRSEGGTRMTETGMSLGTPHYMSPEQAMGEREITAKSDVYALGCVLYEMLTGEPPFTGPTAQAIIARVMTEEPRSLTLQRRTIPPPVEEAVRQALEKLPADRFATAAQFAEALSRPGIAAVPATAARPGAAARAITPRERTLALAPWAVAAVALAAGAWGWLRPAAERTLHVSVPPPAATTFLQHPGWPALSPDGQTVVFAAASAGNSRLYRRPVDGFRAEAIEGSDDATYPFFSPDGAWVGFFTRSRQIRKVPLAGGQPTTIADVPFWRSGAVWRRDGTIVVISDSRGLYGVPDHGGPLAVLTEPDTSAGEYRHDAPQELADGRLLFTVITRERSNTGAHLAILPPGERQWRRLPGDVSGAYVAPGYLATRLGQATAATRYDLARGRASGTSAPVLDGAGAMFTVNDRGDVAYYSFPKVQERFLALVDRSGAARRLPVEAGPYRHPRLSPDGTRLAVQRDGDAWVLDLRSGGWVRLTTNAEITEPQWSSDGRRIAHSAFDTTTGYNILVWRSIDGTGDQHVIHSGMGDDWPSDWSPDGRHVAVYGGPIGMNVSVVDLDSAGTLHPVTRSAGTALARNARFSPDGRWLAYQSNETGRMQVYVVSYPELRDKRPISTEGGTEPAWRPAGGELYYRNGPSMMVVAIRTAPTLEVGTPRELFRGSFEEDLYGDRSYDVMPDGQHFLMFESDPASAPELRVIRNWRAEIDSLLGGP